MIEFIQAWGTIILPLTAVILSIASMVVSIVSLILSTRYVIKSRLPDSLQQPH